MSGQTHLGSSPGALSRTSEDRDAVVECPDATRAGDVSPLQAEAPIHSIIVGAVAFGRHQKRSCQRRTANTAAKTVAASISRAMTQPWKKLIRSLRRGDLGARWAPHTKRTRRPRFGSHPPNFDSQ